MADDADVGIGDTEEAGDIGSRLLVIEGHDDHRAFAFPQRLHALGETLLVELWRGGGRWNQAGAKLLEQLFFAADVAALVEDGHAAGAEDIRCQLDGLAHATLAKRFQGSDENLLDEIVSGVRIAKVSQTVEPDARDHAPAQFGLSFGIAALTDALHQIGFRQFNLHLSQFYV